MDFLLLTTHPLLPSRVKHLQSQLVEDSLPGSISFVRLSFPHLDLPLPTQKGAFSHTPRSQKVLRVSGVSQNRDPIDITQDFGHILAHPDSEKGYGDLQGRLLHNRNRIIPRIGVLTCVYLFARLIFVGQPRLDPDLPGDIGVYAPTAASAHARVAAIGAFAQARDIVANDLGCTKAPKTSLTELHTHE